MRAVRGKDAGQKGGGTHDVSLKVRDGTEPRALPLLNLSDLQSLCAVESRPCVSGWGCCSCEIRMIHQCIRVLWMGKRT